MHFDKISMESPFLHFKVSLIDISKLRLISFPEDFYYIRNSAEDIHNLCHHCLPKYKLIGIQNKKV